MSPRCFLVLTVQAWARIFKLLRSPGIDSKESIPPAYVTWALMFKLLRSPEIDSKESIPPAYLAYSYLVPNPQRLFKNSRTVCPGNPPSS